MGGASDDFKAYGLPIFLILIMGATAGLNHKQFQRSITTKAEVMATWLFRASVLTVLLSFFLFFTSAWAMGLISALVCYIMALFAATGSLRTRGRFMLKLQGAWFAILIGVPEVLSKGIVAKLSTTSCTAFYGDAAPSMCKQGWLTFVEIIAGVILAMTFLSLLVVVSFAVDDAPEAEAESMNELGLTQAQ